MVRTPMVVTSFRPSKKRVNDPILLGNDLICLRDMEIPGRCLPRIFEVGGGNIPQKRVYGKLVFGGIRGAPSWEVSDTQLLEAPAIKCFARRTWKQNPPRETHLGPRCSKPRGNVGEPEGWTAQANSSNSACTEGSYELACSIQGGGVGPNRRRSASNLSSKHRKNTTHSSMFRAAGPISTV